MTKSTQLKQRTATGRVYTGNDCEYIKLCSVTANSGCDNGRDKYVFENSFDDDQFRGQVCDQTGERGEKAVPHPQWWGGVWVCDQGEEVHRMYILYGSHN